MSIQRCPKASGKIPVIRYCFTARKWDFEHTDAYADALHLLERGADPNRAGADGMTFGKMLTEHRAHFGKLKPTPVEFAALWDWAEKHGIIQEAR